VLDATLGAGAGAGSACGAAVGGVSAAGFGDGSAADSLPAAAALPCARRGLRGGA
jgi:hypothetical protein